MPLHELVWRLLVAWARYPWRRRRHRQCLARIARNDRQLAELDRVITDEPKQWRSKHEMETELFFGPGAVWMVDSPDSIQLLARAGMLKSALAEEALWVESNQRLDGTVLINDAIARLRTN